MWRVQSLVGRVLHRCHGSSSLRLPQNHHVEDEVINGSAVLSTSRHSSDSSSQKEEDGERRKQRTFQFGYAELPRYTALDAVGWIFPSRLSCTQTLPTKAWELYCIRNNMENYVSLHMDPGHCQHQKETITSIQGTATLLFMQICRRIHSQFSSSAEPSPTPGTLTATSTLHKCGYRILLEILSRRDVLPRGRNVLCLQKVPERQNHDQTSAQSSSSSSNSSSHSSSEQDQLTADSSISDHQRALLTQDSLLPEESLLSATCSQQNDTNRESAEKTDATNEEILSDEERLTEAALNLRQVGDTSVPVILNIIGLESAKRDNYEEAFTCFLAAAKQGYSKAQFNTGVCYEKGRGVNKDMEKALHYYKQAAAVGHKQAQYRYAKLLLTSRGHQSLEELNTAVSFLEQAAAAGHTKAQVCLASVCSQDPARYGCKSVEYLKMAAESGDNTALLCLGQCYESGFGVQQNSRTALEFYKRAAQAGNKTAKSLITPPNDTYSKEDAVLRSIRSAPCFSVDNRQFHQQLSSLAARALPSTGRPKTLPLLPHSWSTGSLCIPPSLPAASLHLHPSSTERGTCQWTVGIG